MVGKSQKQRRQIEIWEHLGNTDPDWGVAAVPDRKGRRWEEDLDAFYQSGQEAVEEVLSSLPDGHKTGLAIDWGSGTGRLTFALARHYERVVGVDISTSMIEVARARGKQRTIGNVSFIHRGEFRPTGDADLLLSLLTLQHAATVAEVRVEILTMAEALSDEGWMIVHLPVEARSLKARMQLGYKLWMVLRALGVPVRIVGRLASGMSMIFLTQPEVEKLLRDAGLDLARTKEDEDEQFRYCTYFACRRTGSRADSNPA